MEKAPLAIVWPCRLSVAEYAAAGKRIDVPVQACPDCGRTLTWWSGYWRWLRDRMVHRIWVRRGRCRPCRRTHALLPDLVHERRLDTVEVIGEALEHSIGGRGMRKVAARIGVPTATARDWRRRHRTLAPELLARFAELAVRLGDDLADLPSTLEAAVLAALAAAWARARDRSSEGIASMWRFWNVICGGRALGTNTSPHLGAAFTPG